MRSTQIASLVAIGTLICTIARAEPDLTGNFNCTVHQQAGISSIHLEGADPPRAYEEQDVNTTFGMRIDTSPDSNNPFVASETEDRGEHPDRAQYHTNYSLLHSAYYGDGFDFTAAEDQGFLRLHHQKNGNIFFYHSGFEYPGGEDVRLSVRFGECETAD